MYDLSPHTSSKAHISDSPDLQTFHSPINNFTLLDDKMLTLVCLLVSPCIYVHLQPQSVAFFANKILTLILYFCAP